MNIIEILQAEFEREMHTTRKFMAIVPDGKYDWQPHEKSMKLIRLATHIAELPVWIPMTLNTDELDFATSNYTPPKIDNTKELLAFFEQSVVKGREGLENTTEKQLSENWVLRNGETIYETASKYKFLRDWLCQTIHHRAQLGVYFRLLNIPVPSSYGPSADDTSF